MDTSLDYLAHLAGESARFLEALRPTGPSDPVPSCPEWDCDDLLWHLAEVQWFWGAVVGDGVTDVATMTREREERPADRAGLVELFTRVSAELQRVLAAAPPQTPAWTWSADQTVGFIHRRQAHEALIHRVDAELAAGARTPMDPALSADGVDEVLRVMYTAQPDWVAFSPTAGTSLRLAATDTGHHWSLVLGRATGTNPRDGAALDEAAVGMSDGDPGEPAATVHARAADLDCWLWHRPAEQEQATSGDPGVLAGFQGAISDGID